MGRNILSNFLTLWRIVKPDNPKGWLAAWFFTFVFIVQPVGSPECRAQSRHQLFSDILADYIRDGFVDYANLRHDGRLDTYITTIAKTDPDTVQSTNSRLAFWINAYNAYTLKIICDNYPVESINDLHWGGLVVGSILNKTIWDKDFVVIDGEHMTLNAIEHDIIRPIFMDPRAHFALVCASKSCPPLRSEAYEGESLDSQLDDQSRIFLTNPAKNSFDAGAKRARISKIFDWFGEDFGSDDAQILLFISTYLSGEVSESIRRDPKSWDVGHNDYDWSLNGK